MAITATSVDYGVPGNEQFAIVDILLDNSYPTNGYAVTLGNFGFDTAFKFVVPISKSLQGYVPVFDYTNNKIKIFATGAAANAVLNEVPNATDLSAVTLRVFAWGQ